MNTVQRNFYGPSDPDIEAEVSVEVGPDHPMMVVRLVMNHGLFAATLDGRVPQRNELCDESPVVLTLALREFMDGELNMTIDALRWCANQLEKLS